MSILDDWSKMQHISMEMSVPVNLDYYERELQYPISGFRLPPMRHRAQYRSHMRYRAAYPASAFFDEMADVPPFQATCDRTNGILCPEVMNGCHACMIQRAIQSPDMKPPFWFELSRTTMMRHPTENGRRERNCFTAAQLWKRIDINVLLTLVGEFCSDAITQSNPCPQMHGSLYAATVNMYGARTLDVWKHDPIRKLTLLLSRDCIYPKKIAIILEASCLAAFRHLRTLDVPFEMMSAQVVYTLRALLHLILRMENHHPVFFTNEIVSWEHDKLELISLTRPTPTQAVFYHEDMVRRCAPRMPRVQIEIL